MHGLGLHVVGSSPASHTELKLQMHLTTWMSNKHPTNRRVVIAFRLGRKKLYTHGTED
jgi:hypothetical protein